VHVRPGNILVEASNPDHLDHIQTVLSQVNPEQQDVVVVAVHRLGLLGSGEYALTPEQICSDREIDLFSKVVTIAEKAGKHVELLALPGRDDCETLVRAAQQLDSARIVTSPSPNLSTVEQARQVGRAWEKLPTPRPALTLEIVPPRGEDPQLFSLGPHPPRLWPSDVDLVHRLWTELTERPNIGGRLHHRDVVSVALRRLDQELHSKQSGDVVADFERELSREPEVVPPHPNGSG
jgi:hypothetical protein